jgi:hypothetical protein
MPRFDCDATVTFSYVVTAATKEEAEVLLTEALGPDWASLIGSPDVEEHPQIEEGSWGWGHGAAAVPTDALAELVSEISGERIRLSMGARDGSTVRITDPSDERILVLQTACIWMQGVQP